METEDIQKLKKLVKFLRDQGVLSFKRGDFEISLAPSSLFPKPAKESATDLATTDETPFSDEDVMFWSSSGIPADAGKELT